VQAARAASKASGNARYDREDAVYERLEPDTTRHFSEMHRTDGPTSR